MNVTIMLPFWMQPLDRLNFLIWFEEKPENLLTLFGGRTAKLNAPVSCALTFWNSIVCLYFREREGFASFAHCFFFVFPGPKEPYWPTLAIPVLLVLDLPYSNNLQYMHCFVFVKIGFSLVCEKKKAGSLKALNFVSQILHEPCDGLSHCIMGKFLCVSVLLHRAAFHWSFFFLCCISPQDIFILSSWTKWLLQRSQATHATCFSRFALWLSKLIWGVGWKILKIKLTASVQGQKNWHKVVVVFFTSACFLIRHEDNSCCSMLSFLSPNIIIIILL